MGKLSQNISLEPAKEILYSFKKENNLKVKSNYLIPILQKIQDSYGYLPESVILWISENSGISKSRIYGVITFYEQFYTEPQGKHTVKCCRGTACHVKGGAEVLNIVKNAIGIDDGETTDDLLFSLETVACLGACALAPLMVVDDTYYGNITSHRAEKILKKMKNTDS